MLEVKIILYVYIEHFLSILRENIAHSQSKAQEQANEHQAKEAELLAHLERAQNEQRNAAHKCKGGWVTFILRCIHLMQALCNYGALVPTRTGAEAPEHGRRARCERSSPESDCDTSYQRKWQTVDSVAGKNANDPGKGNWFITVITITDQLRASGL